MGDVSKTRFGRRHVRRQQRQGYLLRLLCCLAAGLLLLIAAVRLWPVSTPASGPGPVAYDSHAPVSLRAATPTQQTRRASAPPPAPPVPLYEADARLEQPPLDLSVELAPALRDAPRGPDRRPADGDASDASPAAPDVDARQLRIPEPHYTEAARERDVHAQVEMEVVIAANGRVTDARIVRRVLFPETVADAEAGRTVAELGYGLDEAALDAAERTLFRPARAAGQAVESRKRLTLTFGPE